MASKEAEKLVVIYSKGEIPELGYINGPILNPCKVSISILNRLINKRRDVREVNPEDHSQMVQLNLRNLKTNNFPKKTPAVEKPTMTSNLVFEKKNKKKENPADPKMQPLTSSGDFTEN